MATIISYKFAAQADQFLRTIGQVERSTASIGQRFRESAAAGVAFAAGYKAFDAATNAIGKTGGAIVKYATDLQGARVAWTNLLGSQQAAEAQLLRMQQTAANTPFDFPAVEMGTRRFMAMGFTLQEATEGMNAVIAAASGLNTGTAGIESMVRALGQMRSNVRVNAEDMNQLVDAQVPAWNILAQAMGKSEAEVRKLSEEGKIMSSTFITAFQAWSQARFGDAVVAQSKTLTGALSTIRDNILGTGSTAIQPFIELLTRLALRIATFTSSPAFGQWAAKVAAGLQVAIDTVAALAGHFQSGLSGVLAVVSSAGQAIYEALSWINPFARHSPSLVEQVEAGVDRIIAKYGQLSGGVAAALQGAQGAVQSFLAVSSAGLGAWEESQRQAEAQTLAVFGEGVPAAYLAARESVEQLRAGLAPLAADIERQEGVVDAWAGEVAIAQAAVDAKETSIKGLERAMRPLEEAVKSAQAALEGERQELDAAKDAVDSLKERLGQAQQRLQDFAKTPLAGTQAFADRLFAIEQQATAVELALVQWRLSPELARQLADLSGQIAAQEGVVGQWAARVRDAEAAIRDQETVVASWQGRVREAEGAVKDQEAVVGQWSARIKEAQRELEAQERALDVWKGRIADAEGAVKDQEAVVAGWTARIREAERALEDQVAALDGYKGRIKDAEAAVVAQDAVVAGWTARVREAERALREQEAGLSIWDDRLRAAEGAVKDQESVVAGWTARVREAQRALDDQERALSVWDERIRDAEAAVRAQGAVVDGWTARVREAEGALREQERALSVWDERLRRAQGAIDAQETIVKRWAAGIREAEAELKRQERSLDVWQDRLRAAAAAITDQERAVRSAELGLRTFDRRVDEAKETLDRQKLALVGAKDQVDAYAGGLKDAIREIDNLARAQLQGSQGFSDQAFAIEQQAAAVKFALNDIERGIEPTRAGEILRAQLVRAQQQAAATGATLAAMYEGPVANPQDLLLAANADDFARERVASINRALGTLDPAGSSEGDVAALKSMLDELGLSADQVRLREKLELDPLRRDVERLARGADELSFKAVVDGITAAKERQAELLSGQAAATAAWERQAVAVDTAAAALANVERARDAQQAAVGAEKSALADLKVGLDDLKDGYDRAKAALDPYREAVERQRQGEADAKLALDQRRDALQAVKRSYDEAKAGLEPYRRAIEETREGEQGAKAALDQTRAALAGVKQQYDDARAALDPYRQAVEDARLRDQDAKVALDERRDALAGVKDGYEAARQALDPYRQAIEEARLGEQDAKAALDDKRVALDGIKREYQDALDALDPYRQAIEDARRGEQDAKDALGQKRDALQSVKDGYEAAKAGLDPYRLAVEEARRGEEDAKAVLDQKRDALDSVKQGYDQARAGLDTLKGALDAAREGERGAKADLDALNDSFKAAQQPPANLTAELERLRLEAQQVKLQEQLQLDPLRREIEALANPVRELTFKEIRDGMAGARAEIATLEPQLAAATAAWEEQRGAVRRAEGALAAAEGARDAQRAAIEREQLALVGLRDQLEATQQRHRREQDTLAGLQGAYAAATAEINRMEQQLDGVQRAGAAATAESERLRKEQEKLAALGQPKMPAPIYDPAQLADQFKQLADTKERFEVTKAQIEARVGLWKERIRGYYDAVREKFSEVRDAVMGVLGPAFDWFDQYVLPIVIRFGTFVRDNFNTIVAAVSAGAVAFKTLSVVVGIAAAVVGALNPVTLAIGVLSIGAGLFAAAWVEDWRGIRGATQSVIAFVQGQVIPALTDLGTRLGEAGRAFAATFTPERRAILAQFASTFLAVGSETSAAGRALQLAGTYLPSLVVGFGDLVGKLIDALGWLQSTGHEADVLKVTLYTIGGWIALNKFADLVTQLQDTARAAHTTWDALTRGPRLITTRIERLFVTEGDDPAVAQRVADALKAGSRTVTNTIKTAWATAQDAVIWAQLYGEQAASVVTRRIQTVYDALPKPPDLPTMQARIGAWWAQLPDPPAVPNLSGRIQMAYDALPSAPVLPRLHVNIGSVWDALPAPPPLPDLGTMIRAAWDALPPAPQIPDLTPTIRPTMDTGFDADKLGRGLGFDTAKGMAAGIGGALGGLLAGAVTVAGLATAGAVVAGALATAFILAAPVYAAKMAFDFVDEFIKQYPSASDAFYDFFVRIIPEALGRAAAGIVNAAMQAVVWIVDGIGKAAPKIWDFITTNWPQLLVGAIWAVFGPIPALVVAILGQVGDDLLDLGRRLWGVVTRTWDDITGAVEQAGERIRDAVLRAGIRVGIVLRDSGIEFWSTVTDTWDRITTIIASALVNAWDAVRDGTLRIWQRLVQLKDEVWDAIKRAFEPLGDALRAIIEGRWMDALNSGLEFVRRLFFELPRRLWAILSDGFEDIVGIFRDTGRRLWQTLSDAWDAITTTLQGAWDRIARLVQGAWEQIKGIFRDTIGTIRAALSDAWDSIRDTLVRAWEGIRDAVGRFLFDVWARFEKFKEDAKQTLRDAWDAITGAAGEFLGNFLASFERHLNRDLVERLRGFRTTITTTLQEAWDTIGGAAERAWTWLRTTVADAAGGVRDDVVARITGAKNLLDTIWIAVSGAATGAWDWMKRHFSEGGTALRNALLWPFEQIRDNIGGILDGMKENMLTALRGARGAFVAFTKTIGAAINWVAGKIPGVSFTIKLEEIDAAVPQFATGARNFTGGPAIVGEEGPELVVLPRHATVVPADLTQQLLDAGVPGFAGGLNLPDLGDLFDVLAKPRGWVFDRAKEAVGLHDLDLPGALGEIGRGFAGTVKGWTLDYIERLLKGAIPVTPTLGGVAGARGTGWGDPSVAQIDALLQRYGGGRSPFSGADIDRLSAQYGVPEGLILGLLQKESQMGSNAGGLEPFFNAGGITGTQEDIAAGRTVHYVFPNGDTRDFLKFGSWAEYLDYKYQFLMGSYYKGRSLEELIGNYYAGPAAFAKYGVNATDYGGGGQPSPNGTVQDYINLVLNIERQLTGNVPDQRGVPIGNAPTPTTGPDPGVVLGPAWDGWSAPLASYVVTQEFGHNDFAAERYASGSHGGIDLVGPHAAAVLAAALGTVTGAGWNGGYGNAVTLDHGAGLTSIYGHLDAITVALNEVVARGWQIGVQGNTGNSTGEHLHFETRRNGIAVNPREFVTMGDGGIITEPIVGRGVHSKRGYLLGEHTGRGEYEYVIPAGDLPRRAGDGRRVVEIHAPITINVQGGDEVSVERAVRRGLRRAVDEMAG